MKAKRNKTTHDKEIEKKASTSPSLIKESKKSLKDKKLTSDVIEEEDQNCNLKDVKNVTKSPSKIKKSKKKVKNKKLSSDVIEKADQNCNLKESPSSVEESEKSVKNKKLSSDVVKMEDENCSLKDVALEKAYNPLEMTKQRIKEDRQNVKEPSKTEVSCSYKSICFFYSERKLCFFSPLCF